MLVLKSYVGDEDIPAVKPEKMTDLDFRLVTEAFRDGIFDLLVVRLACAIMEANRIGDAERFLAYVDT